MAKAGNEIFEDIKTTKPYMFKERFQGYDLVWPNVRSVLDDQIEWTVVQAPRSNSEPID
jgi:hypothetical protein